MDIGHEVRASEEGAWMHVTDKHGDPAWQLDPEEPDNLEKRKPVQIKFAGTDSSRYREAVDKRGGSRRNKRGSNPLDRTPEEWREDRAFLLASLTLFWDGIVVNKTVWECSFENAHKLFLLAPWIAEQADRFTGDRTNF